MAIKKYDSALRENVHMWVNKIKTVDLLVGIPCFNNEDTIGFVIEQVCRGLAEHFPDMSTAVFVSDGGSLDNTREYAKAGYDLPWNAGQRHGVSGDL